MRKSLLFCLFFVVLIPVIVFAQAPETFLYQGVLRNSLGELLSNSNVSLRVSVVENNPDGEISYSEIHSVVTNDFGQFSVKIGNGEVVSGDFLSINWASEQVYLKTELDETGESSFTELGTVQLLSVPYALYAKNAGYSDSTIWKIDANNIFYKGGNVGIGSQTPISKLEVKSDELTGALFQVINAQNDTVFAVYPDGVKVLINQSAKGKIGGFAVSGRTSTKSKDEEYLLVTPDSTRIYVNQDNSKGKIGGFAVSGRTSTKQVESNFLDLTPDNYFIGHESGQKTQSFVGSDHGKYNVFLGYESGKENLTGLQNVFIGYKTALSNTHGMTNVYIGSESGYSNTLGYDNVFIGSTSGYSNTEGINNVFLGSRSGYLNDLGEDNVFVGFETGFNNTTGIMNTFIGNKAGRANVDGNDNIFIGELAGYENISGSENIFIGKRAGHMTLNSQENTFIGSYSGQQTTSGTGNTFLGHRTGLGNQEGSQNTYIGALAVNRDSTGNDNVAIGFNAGGWSYGSNNVYIGVGAGMNTVGDSNVFIGYNAGSNDTTSHTLYIATHDYEDSTLALVYGRFDYQWLRINNALGIGRNPEVNELEVKGNASKSTAGDWLANSDQRIKTDIQEIDNAFETILKLRPVKFKYTDYWKSKHESIKDQYYYNFIAQEYQEVFPESVQGSGEFIEGDPDEILQLDSYNAQIVTIKAVQDLIKETNDLKNQNQELKNRINKLELLVEELIND